MRTFGSDRRHRLRISRHTNAPTQLLQMQGLGPVKCRVVSCSARCSRVLGSVSNGMSPIPSAGETGKLRQTPPAGTVCRKAMASTCLFLLSCCNGHGRAGGRRSHHGLTCSDGREGALYDRWDSPEKSMSDQPPIRGFCSLATAGRTLMRGMFSTSVFGEHSTERLLYYCGVCAFPPSVTLSEQARRLAIRSAQEWSELAGNGITRQRDI